MPGSRVRGFWRPTPVPPDRERQGSARKPETEPAPAEIHHQRGLAGRQIAKPARKSILTEPSIRSANADA